MRGRLLTGFLACGLLLGACGGDGSADDVATLDTTPEVLGDSVVREASETTVTTAVTVEADADADAEPPASVPTTSTAPATPAPRPTTTVAPAPGPGAIEITGTDTARVDLFGPDGELIAQQAPLTVLRVDGLAPGTYELVAEGESTGTVVDPETGAQISASGVVSRTLVTVDNDRITRVSCVGGECTAS